MERIAVLARRALKMVAVTLSLATLAGCGGGGGGSEPAPPPPQAPTITAQPLAASVPAGTTATFTVAASGTTPLGYLWRRNGTPITGATESSYTTPVLSVADSGATFSVVVSNAAGSLTSAEAPLTVSTNAGSPSITTQPRSITMTIGGTATFAVAASGVAPLIYQWRRDGVDIPNAIAASYTTPPLISADNGAVFSVRVSNAAGVTVSSEATLTVVAASNGTLMLSGETVAAGRPALYTPNPQRTSVSIALPPVGCGPPLLCTAALTISFFDDLPINRGITVQAISEGASPGAAPFYTSAMLADFAVTPSIYSRACDRRPPPTCELTGLTIDPQSRRITFVDVVLRSDEGKVTTLNGTLFY